MSNTILFPTSIVGSMPRPDSVRDLVMGNHELSPEQYEHEMDAACSQIVAMQERAGLDVLSDGEWRRRSYIGVIAELAHGFELSTNSADGRPWTVVTDRLSPKHTGFIAKEVEFVRGITDRSVKATLPAPALLGERMWDATASAKAYPTREDFVRDCVPILRRELESLRSAGADIIQIEDPHLCLFVDPEVRGQYEDPDAAAEFAVDTVNELVDGFDGVKLALHLCRRAGARVRGEAQHSGGYDLILPQLNRLSVQHITMEFTDPASCDATVFGRLREDFEIGLGCVGVTPGVIDTPEEIVERVEIVLRHLDPQRVTLNPDCGFAPGSGAAVSIDEVYVKLQNQVEAARRLRG
ncbi:MAG: cobalamin-independent methionine synthase II family protein [Planctomycetota bacterium]|nr:cobalamin-independent methionine synthase II family protein [Planctomycetota bacterium]